MRAGAGAAVLVALGGCGGGGGGSPVVGPSDPSCPAVVTPVANEGWIHVAEGGAVAYRANPPVMAADFVVAADCVNAGLVRDFATGRRGRGPEQVCADGTRP